MNPAAQLDVTRSDEAVVASIKGEIDLSNAAELGAAVEAALPREALGAVLDLSRTTYVDSAGVRLLFGLGSRLSRRSQQLRVVVPEQAPIMKVLKLTGLTWTVPHDGSVDDALAGLRSDVRREPGADSWISPPGREPFYS